MALMITDYFQQLKDVIKKHQQLIVHFTLKEKVHGECKGSLEGEIVFSDKSRLNFTEVKDTWMDFKFSYRYLYINAEAKMVFKYDNARHHHDVATFPHHKHTPDGFFESEEPNLQQIFNEVKACMFQKEEPENS